MFCLSPWELKETLGDFCRNKKLIRNKNNVFHRQSCFYHDSLPLGFNNNTIFSNKAYDTFSLFWTPFIFSLKFFQNRNTRFSPRSWTAKNWAVSSNHWYLIQERLGIFYNKKQLIFASKLYNKTYIVEISC